MLLPVAITASKPSNLPSTKVILEKIDAKCDEDIQYKTTFFDESLSLRGLQLIKKEANKISLVDIIENEIKKIKLSDLDQKNPTKNFTKKIDSIGLMQMHKYEA